MGVRVLRRAGFSPLRGLLPRLRLVLCALFVFLAPDPSRAACQAGDPCSAPTCTSGCLSYQCIGGSYLPAAPLSSGAPCADVSTGACESCTCGELGQLVFSDRPAGSACGVVDACASNLCDGAGLCETTFASIGASCGPSGETCDGVGACLAGEAGGALAPGSLLVYYGIPGLINGAAGDLDLAAQALGRYDFVVLGAGLEVPPGEPGALPDHSDTVAIVGHPAMSDTQVFGYVDLGVADTAGALSAFSIPEIAQRAAWWLELVGADGIFLDDFGYDFCVSRARQNDAMAAIRALDPSRTIPIVANAFRPDDVFGDEPSHAFATPWCDPTVAEPVFVANPDRIPPVIGAQDHYFYESHQVINGDFEANDFAFDWQFKSQYLENVRASLDVGILSTTTIDATDPYDEQAFFYSWYSAALYGHVATGWGEVLFSAPTSAAPYHARPAVDLGNQFLTSPARSADLVRWSRDTDLGEIWIDTRSHESGFVPEPRPSVQLTAGLLALSGLVSVRHRRRKAVPARGAPLG